MYTAERNTLNHVETIVDILLEQYTKYISTDSPVEPFIIGLTGSVAAGKTTFAKTLKDRLENKAELECVEVLGTDNFLLSNSELEALGLMRRKGFPESYNNSKIANTLEKLKFSKESVEIERYDHAKYDIVENVKDILKRTRIVIVEGLNILHPERNRSLKHIFNLTIYLDAPERFIFQWYKSRVDQHIEAAKTNPKSYYHQFCKMEKEKLSQSISEIWREINQVNLHNNILPCKNTADMVVEKDEDHNVSNISVQFS